MRSSSLETFAELKKTWCFDRLQSGRCGQGDLLVLCIDCFVVPPRNGGERINSLSLRGGNEMDDEAIFVITSVFFSKVKPEAIPRAKNWL
jgi:hypothetical protein